jgi:hypothetical protein
VHVVPWIVSELHVVGSSAGMLGNVRLLVTGLVTWAQYVIAPPWLPPS